MAERESKVESVNDRDAGRVSGETSPPGGGIVGALLTPVTVVAAGIAALGSALWHDRAFWAFARQGVDELGTAFGKMVPDSIQVDESGSLWNPTQGEIASAARDTGGLHRMNWASLRASRSAEAEQQNTQQPEQDRGKEQDNGMSM
jgi:hypothetical protein